MGKIFAAIQALRHGASLADPAVWKQRQNLVNALTGLFSAAVIFLPEQYRGQLDGEAITAIALGVATVVGLFVNPYLTVATTDKIGLPAQREAAAEPIADRAPEQRDNAGNDDLYRPGA